MDSALKIVEGRFYFNAPGASASFPLLDLRTLIFKPISDSASIFGAGLFGTTFNKDAGLTEKFTLGGPFRLGAFDRDEFRGNHLFLASIGYQRKIYQLPPLLGGKIFAIASYNVGGAYDDFRSPDYNHEGAVGFIIDTKFGPFTLFGNYGEGRRGKVFFTFGRFF